jgi:N,N'-diacetyllegionaminate synthase
MDSLVSTINIANQTIGMGHPCFVIAEAGVNHNGNLQMALALVDKAAEAGANAIKFQTFKTEYLVTPDAVKASYQQQTTSANESQFEMLKRLELSQEAHKTIFAHCNKKNILFMSTPFEEGSADFLESLNISVFKIPSGEITNLSFLNHIAKKQIPLIVSTGMSHLGEVEAAVNTIYSTGNSQLALLHCVSNYPTEPHDVNLKAMHTLHTAFGYPVGYSDHTQGIEIALAAVALGACVIEKHFTLDRTLPGPDHQASLEPQELCDLIRGIRKVENAMGSGQKVPAASEENSASVIRKSLVAAQNIAKGEILTENAIAIRRPGTGLPPTMRPFLIGRTTTVNISEGTVLSLDMLS